MKKLPNNKLGIFLILTGALLILSQISHAQTALRTFTIVPPAVEKALNPGERTEGILKVINDSEETLVFTVTMRDFVVEDSKGTPKFLPQNSLDNRYSAANWIAVSPTTFSLLPHKRQELNYFIQVPGNARPGGHYAAVVYKPASGGNIQGSGSSVSTQIGSLFYVGVNGDIKESASILSFLSKSFQEYGPVSMAAKIKNNGDLHIKPQGNISVYNFLGQRVDLKGLPENNIFPGGVVRDYQQNVGSKIMVGPYTAKLLASYGKNNNLPLTAAFTFWVFPWRLVLLLVLIIIAAVLGYLYIQRGKNKDITPPKEGKEEPETSTEPQKA